MRVDKKSEHLKTLLKYLYELSYSHQNQMLNGFCETVVIGILRLLQN